MRTTNFKIANLTRTGLILLLAFALTALAGCAKQTIAPDQGSYSSSGSQQSSSSGTKSSGYGYGNYNTQNSSQAALSGTQAGQGGTPQRGTKPYTVMGKTYHPLLTAEGFYEEGIASWYGKDFHGKQTACGERYDMYGATAAHKLLPFGTMVKVTNKLNGKSIVVRINDRGPFVDNRVIDLTHTGATQLDMLTSGTAPVTIETVGAVKGLQEGKLTGSFYVQIGAFGVESNAHNLVAKMQARGHSARAIYASSIGLWRVQLGPYNDLQQAEAMSDSLIGEFGRTFVVAD